jgi:hypothetical protein
MSTPRNKRKSAARESFHGSDGVFTKPWSAAVSYRRQGAEMVCVENPNEYFHGRRAAVPTADKPDF